MVSAIEGFVNKRKQVVLVRRIQPWCVSNRPTTMFFCAISGEPPLEPVVSAKSGKVYERRLIVKYITENGTDPITGEKLEESDLIAIKACTSS